MRTKHALIRTAALAGILGAALLLGAGPLATPAQAHSRHKQVKVHRHTTHPRTVVRHEACDPRPFVVRHRARPVRVVRPWYSTAPRFYVSSSPYYFHAGLNLYLGGVNLNLEFTDPAPPGYVYLDPYCDREFHTVAGYHRHLRKCGHPAALQVVFVGY